MSRSLSRIRSLVSEIEEIHRHGQQGGRAAMTRTADLKADASNHEPVISPQAKAAPPLPEEVQDPFEELSKVVNLDDHRDPFSETPKRAKVFMQLTGGVVLNLQIEDAGETVELKQVGDLLEIRFLDGKAFHIPLKAMA